MLEPAGGQRRDRRAHRHRREEQAGPLRAGVVDADGEHREQRPRHPERHRHEVDRERAHQRLVAAHEAQALGDRAQASAACSPSSAGAAGAHGDERGHHRQAADRVDRVRRADAERADEQAAEPGPDDHRQLVEPKLSASAERSCAGSTRLGTIAERVTFWIAPKPASSPPRT